MNTRHGTAVVTLPADCEILITRGFAAPQALVWELITNLRHVMRWWGPSWCPLASCDIDLRVGGAWHYTARLDGAELVWRGVYLAIEVGKNIVSTECFEGFPDAKSTNTMTLTHRDDVTTLQTRVVHTSKEFRDGHIDSGMEIGMQDTFNRLEDLLGLSDTPAEQFRRVAGRFSDRVHEVPAEAWDNDAPCAGWKARDVVGHMVEWMPGMLRGADVHVIVDADVADDPVGAWESLRAQVQAALDDPVVAQREFDAGPPGVMTVERAIAMIMTGDIVTQTARGQAFDRIAGRVSGQSSALASRTAVVAAGCRTTKLAGLLQLDGEKTPLAVDALERVFAAISEGG